MASADTVVALAFCNGSFVPRARALPAEEAVAISVGGSTHAVMMATPQDLEDMAIGLMLNERIVDRPDEIEAVEIVASDGGVDCQVRLIAERAQGYVARRRQMTGPVGCGLCGVESLELARPALPAIGATLRLDPRRIVKAMSDMAEGQLLGRQTRAVHAAAFHTADGGCLVVREDVGRHNALDKVAGHLARQRIAPAHGFLTLTSRVSVELVQKAAVMGCGLLAAISVPSELAVREAEGAGVTLIAVARGEEFEIFTHPGRVDGAL
ncbi:formate dehydrogenase accessory sulfurtransferase FdhD [Aureimonas frigidaquae]|uniref:formate dehydrogenase accessory sulfurtransferase FdhD n=1 Tax=Aureimonas frigidaquae TaxID=424757 RepID=UPI000783DC7B|nr:formate dehydrogenase accessory sulfurtransferase FdhD [Aureimonas frigidaquae]